MAFRNDAAVMFYVFPAHVVGIRQSESVSSLQSRRAGISLKISVTSNKTLIMDLCYSIRYQMFCISPSCSVWLAKEN